MAGGYPRAQRLAAFALKWIRSAHGVGLCGSVFGRVLNIFGASEELKVGALSLRQKLSAFPEKEQDKLAEGEFRRLQVQFRRAGEKNRSYGAKTRRQLQAQEQEIESLAQEQKEVLSTLSQITSRRNVMLDERNRTELHRLLQSKSKHDSLIGERKALLAALEKQILELEQEIASQKRRAAKVKDVKRSERLPKQAETLETSLYNVTVRFHTAVSRNKQLHEEIESLQIQKAALNNIFFKLHRKLEKQRRRMNSALQQSTEVYEEWMETLNRTREETEKQREDAALHERQKRVLGAVQIEMKTFMDTKLRDLSELKEKAQKNKALKAAKRIRQRQAEAESFESLMPVYQQLLEQAENGDIDRLIDSFVAENQKEFSCFSYAIEVNKEMAKMQQRINDQQSRIAALIVDEEPAEESLEEVEAKIMETTKEANMYEKKYKESSKLLGQLRSGVEALLKETSCDATKITWPLGDNLAQILGLLEKRTRELLLQESILRYTSAEGSHLAQPFAHPLLGGTELLWGMDRAQLCPTAPAPNGTADAIGASNPNQPPPPHHGCQACDGVRDGWPFSWAVEVPLDHGQLRQLILQRHEKQQADAPGTGKRRRARLKISLYLLRLILSLDVTEQGPTARAEGTACSPSRCSA
ncbi:coiled-coil domain-containing protein 63-like [Leptosomus discolor]